MVQTHNSHHSIFRNPHNWTLCPTCIISTFCWHNKCCLEFWWHPITHNFIWQYILSLVGHISDILYNHTDSALPELKMSLEFKFTHYYSWSFIHSKCFCFVLGLKKNGFQAEGSVSPFIPLVLHINGFLSLNRNSRQQLKWWPSMYSPKVS